MDKKVLVKIKNGVYTACLEGSPTMVCGSGDSMYNAVGEMVFTNQKEFGLDIFVKTEKLAENRLMEVEVPQNT